MSLLRLYLYLYIYICIYYIMSLFIIHNYMRV